MSNDFTPTAVILAGGLGTRFGDVTASLPKPLIEIAGIPILWHIMKLYDHHGIRRFIICAGYKGHMIKEFFSQYVERFADIAIDTVTGERTVLRPPAENWHVEIIDTGLETQTGGRLARVRAQIGDVPYFLMTYGDSLTDVDVAATIAFHRRHGKKASMSVVTPPSKYGGVTIGDGLVTHYREKPVTALPPINAGFFVLHPSVLDLVSDDTTVWERQPLEALASQGELAAWQHPGFWHPMDTIGDLRSLETLWTSGKAPWKVWR